MDAHLSNPSSIKGILRQFGIRPAKSLGQNFMSDGNIVRKIIDAADLQKNDTVLEIGPGLGVLTVLIAAKVKKVIAVEIDPVMVDILKATTHEFKNVVILHADILNFDLAKYGLSDQKYKLISNLPYQITSPVINKFLNFKPRPNSIFFTIQKEVGHRIVATPPDANFLSNLVQLHATPKVLFDISPKSFWPVPDVDSSLIKIDNVGENKFGLDDEEEKKLLMIIKAGFREKRKQLINSLSSGLKIDKSKVKTCLDSVKIDSMRRAETLSLKEWYRISSVLG